MIETRCPLNKSDIDAWYSGDLHKMFERITTQPEFAQYEPKVFSRPDLLPGDTQATAPYLIGPWVVTLENVVTEEEAVRLIELGAVEGYERSADVGELKFDGTFDSFVNEGRTSTNAWCQNACYADPTAKRVMERIQNITNTPEPNSEFLQLLRYEEGQFYQQHHDYIGHQRERQEGVRILTVFLYLNDVEEGGGTNFPKLNLTVLPKRGRALLWPSVLNEDPNAQDPRTDHQALPVIKGIKYGA
jgi:prolyl 4-hydroxylase